MDSKREGERMAYDDGYHSADDDDLESTEESIRSMPLYDEDGIEREVVYIGPAPNFMENLKLELEVEGTLDPKEQEEATEE